MNAIRLFRVPLALIGTMLLLLWMVLLLPLSPLLTGLLLLAVIAIGVFTLSILVAVLQAQGTGPSLRVRQQLWRVQKLLGGWMWLLDVAVVMGVFALLMQGKYTAAVLLLAAWFVFGFARTMVTDRLARWSQP